MLILSLREEYIVDFSTIAVDHTTQLFSSIKDNASIAGKATICTNSLCITYRAGIKFYCYQLFI